MNAARWFNAGNEPPTTASCKGTITVVAFLTTYHKTSVEALTRLEKLRGSRATIILLLAESPERVGSFVEKHHVRYVTGAGSTTHKSCGVTRAPWAWVVGADGLVTWAGNVLDPTLERAASPAATDAAP